jgi:hypothetical protein
MSIPSPESVQDGKSIVNGVTHRTVSVAKALISLLGAINPPRDSTPCIQVMRCCSEAVKWKTKYLAECDETGNARTAFVETVEGILPLCCNLRT